jgi:hypothetical protein
MTSAGGVELVELGKIQNLLATPPCDTTIAEVKVPSFGEDYLLHWEKTHGEKLAGLDSWRAYPVICLKQIDWGILIIPQVELSSLGPLRNICRILNLKEPSARCLIESCQLSASVCQLGT